MIFLLGTMLIMGSGDPGPVLVELLPAQSEAMARMPRVEWKGDANGKTVTYSGVALASILARRAKPVEGMAGLRELSDAVLLVRGEDGYQAAISATAVLMDPKGERYLLANRRDGVEQTPQLIIPGDPKHVRWVRDVVAVRLVRLDRVVKADP